MTPTAKAIREKQKVEEQAKQVADLVDAVNALTAQVQDLIAKVDARIGPASALTPQAKTSKGKGV